MSYSLGQAKWVPGQISFSTTRTGRLPTPQKLIEAGLPYAPYIEHGSWVTGQPDIARYGRDPYRGISGPIGYLGAAPEAQLENSTYDVWVENMRCRSWRGRGRRNAIRAAKKLARKHRRPVNVMVAGCVPAPTDRVLPDGRVTPPSLGQLPDPEIERRADETQQAVTEAGQEAVRTVAKVGILVGLGAVAGGAAGLVGGLLNKPVWSTLIGSAGGGALGYLAYDRLRDA